VPFGAFSLFDVSCSLSDGTFLLLLLFDDSGVAAGLDLFDLFDVLLFKEVLLDHEYVFPGREGCLLIVLVNALVLLGLVYESSNNYTLGRLI